MTRFAGLETQLAKALALGFTVHSLHQEAAFWHCRLKIWNSSMMCPRYASGDGSYPAAAVENALHNVKAVMEWRPTLSTLTKLKALKPDLEALLKEI
jgi:hypothetical protein